MKTKDLLETSAVAFATAAAAIVTLYPGNMGADNDSAELAAKIAKPKLVLDGVEITASSDRKAYQAGDEPGFELQAVNTGERAAEVCVRVSLTATSPTSAFSRVVSLPAVLWNQDLALTLAPGEHKALALKPARKLPGNSVLNLVLAKPTTPAPATNISSGPTKVSFQVVQPEKERVVALSFSTAAGSTNLLTALFPVQPGISISQ